MKKMYFLRMLPKSSKLPLAKQADDVMETEDFREYVATHGYHMSDKLAEHASMMLRNANGSSHMWTVAQVRDAIGKAENGHTCGDQAYLANMLYSDFYGRPAESEAKILEMVKSALNDPDGYEGMVMLRYVADLIGRGETVDWAAMI